MRPPAFQFYADDFLAGTADMTPEEVGGYIRALCHQWNRGGLPDDNERLALMMGISNAHALQHIRTKFKIGEDGLLRNERLERTRQEQDDYRASRKQNAVIGWEKRRSMSNAHASDTVCSPSPTPSPEDNKRESSGEPATARREDPFPEANIPTWEEVKQMAAMRAIPEAVARKFWDHYDSKNLWQNKHGRMINVLNTLVIWANNEKQGRPNGNSRTNHPQRIDRSVGTANEGVAGQYRGLGRLAAAGNAPGP